MKSRILWPHLRSQRAHQSSRRDSKDLKALTKNLVGHPLTFCRTVYTIVYRGAQYDDSQKKAFLQLNAQAATPISKNPGNPWIRNFCNEIKFSFQNFR